MRNGHPPIPGFLWLALSTVVASAAGCDGLDGARTQAHIHGRAWLAGPVGAGARVSLYTSDDAARLGAQLAETQTDADGRFDFESLTGFGPAADLRVEVDLDGLAWETRAGVRGTYAAEDRLVALARAVPSTGAVEVHATPWSTLLVAATTARHIAGEQRPLDPVVGAMTALVGVDLVREAVGEPGPVSDPAAMHRLLVDAFEVLAVLSGERAGLGGAALSPPALLRALADDAMGTASPGVFDGAGPEGAVRLGTGGSIELGPGTLREELVAALHTLLEEAPWRGTTRESIAHVTEALRCDASPLLGPAACDPVSPPAPGFESFDPPDGAEITGDVEITITLTDTGGPVEEVSLSPWTDRGAGLPYPLVETRGRRWVFRVDTRETPGFAALRLHARLVAASGLEAARDLTYQVRNLGSGTIGGHVVKGPARWVGVEAFGLHGDRRTRLTATLTDAHGAFGMQLDEWTADPVELIAVDASDGARLSGYRDEARGGIVRWGPPDTLTAVVPAYDAEAPEPVVISPWTDLAWAAAGARALRPGGAARLTEYLDVLEALGAHLGMEAPRATLLTARPAPHDAPLDAGLRDAERFMVGLGCLARLAADIAHAARPERPDDLTALDLVAALRADVAADGIFDGRAGTTPVPVMAAGEPVATLPPDPLRRPLAEACIAWLESMRPVQMLGGAAFLTRAERMSASTDPRLFGPDAAPSVFDDAPPTVEVWMADGPALALDADGRWTADGAPALASGRLALTIHAVDSSGVARLRVEAPAHEDARIADAPPAPGHPGEGVEVRAEWDTTSGPDGPWSIAVVAEDAFGHTARHTVPIVVDNTPPALTLELVEPLPAQDGRFHVRTPTVVVRARATDASPVRLEGALLRDRTPPIPLDFDADGVAVAPVGFAGVDGAVAVRARATDAFGRTAEGTLDFLVDTTPPTPRLVGTICRDEQQARWADGLDVAEAPAIALPGPAPIRKWQTTWGRGAPNPARLRFALDEAEASPLDALEVAVQRCFRGACRTERPAPAAAIEVPLYAAPDAPEDAAALPGFDPVGAPPAAAEVVEVTVTVTDLAGNVGEWTGTQALVVVPPGLAVEDVDIPPDHLRLADLSFEDDSIRDFLGGTPNPPARVIRRLRLTNPHPIPVGFVLQFPRALDVTVRAERRFEVVFADVDVPVVPDCWADVPPWDGAQVRGSHWLPYRCGLGGCAPVDGGVCEAWGALPFETFETTAQVRVVWADGNDRLLLGPGEEREVWFEVDQLTANLPLPAPDYRYPLQSGPGVWQRTELCGAGCVRDSWHYGTADAQLTRLTAAPGAEWGAVTINPALQTVGPTGAPARLSRLEVEQ